MNYTWKQFDEDCQKIVKWIKENAFRFENIYGIPKGGMILAIRLANLLNIHLIIDKKEVNSKTLICEDIVDTGKTLRELLLEFNLLHLKSNLPTIVTLFWHKQTITKPDFTCREKKDKWIIFPWERE